MQQQQRRVEEKRYLYIRERERGGCLSRHAYNTRHAPRADDSKKKERERERDDTAAFDESTIAEEVERARTDQPLQMFARCRERERERN